MAHNKLYFTCGVAPFDGSAKTLKAYVRQNRLGEVARINDRNRTPLLTPAQVTRANKLYQRRTG